MLFRFHRGGFTESMQTTVEVKSMDELIDVIGFPHEITFENPYKDNRNDWEQNWYVMVDGKPIGMSNSNKF